MPPAAAAGNAAGHAAPVRHGRFSLALLLLALLCGLFVSTSAARGPWLQPVEHFVRDAFLRLLASSATDPRIGLVDIDEESLQRVGPWPWPRRELATLAEQLLSSYGARLVVFDLVLPEPAVGDDAVGDARLAALARAHLLVSAQAFDYVKREPVVRAGVPGGALAATAPVATASATGHVAGFGMLAANGCVGNVGFTPDTDGQMRRLPLLTRWDGRNYPTLALAAWWCAHRSAAAFTASRSAGTSADTGTDIGTGTGPATGDRADPEAADLAWLATLPVDAAGQWQLRFGRSPESFAAVPAHVVLASAGPDAALNGRIVLVGSSALGLSDRVATPIASSMAGVIVHAGALGELLDAAGEEKPAASAAARTMTVAPILASALALIWLVSSTVFLWRVIARARRLRFILAAIGTVFVGWFGLCAWLVHGGRMVPVSAPLWSYAFLLLVQLPAEWSVAQARVRARTRLLSRYVARPVLDELLAQESDDPLVTRDAEISVLIADMQDYTRMTAFSTLEEAAALTRQFLDCLTRPVLDGKGTLDKYTGDGLVAFWGAPLPVADHTARALQAALGIHAAVAHFNGQRALRGDLPVRVRIGLATGRALVGDLGTPFRSTYTAVGDVINLASRLQQAARDFDDDIVASREFAEACPDHVFRPIGAISPRGLDRIEVFSPGP